MTATAGERRQPGSLLLPVIKEARFFSCTQKQKKAATKQNKTKQKTRHKEKSLEKNTQTSKESPMFYCICYLFQEVKVCNPLQACLQGGHFRSTANAHVDFDCTQTLVSLLEFRLLKGPPTPPQFQYPLGVIFLAIQSGLSSFYTFSLGT